MNKRQISALFVALAMFALVLALLWTLFPLITQLMHDRHNLSALTGYIKHNGARDVPILLGMQALQVVVAVIPSFSIQLLSGLCYGIWWGALITIVGNLIGNILVFGAIRQMRTLLAPFFKQRNRHERLISPEKLSKMAHPERIAFFFFLIPGLPSSIIPYVFANTNVQARKYMLAVIFGSLPTALLYTFIGEQAAAGHYVLVLILGGLVALFFIGVFIFRKSIMARIMH